MALLPWLSALRWWHLLLLVTMLVAVAIVARPLVFPQPTAHGATLATVHGKPVTEADIQAEARGAGLDPDTIGAKSRQAMLSQVIERRLLVAAATDEGLDRDALLQASVARAREMVAAGAMAATLVGTPAPPSDAQVKRYIAAHPFRFARREALVLDTIAIASARLPEAMLASADSLDALTSSLRAAKLPFERGVRRVDSASLSPELAAKLVQAGPGALFRLPAGRRALLATITARQPVSLSPDEQTAAARRAVAEEQRESALDKALSALRRKALKNEAEPITENDLLAEAKGAGLRAEALDPATRQTLLSKVVDRRLLVAAARDLDAERNPAVRASVQRAGEMVVAGAMAQRVVGQPAPATTEEAQRFMADNPLRFGKREILVVDAIEIDASRLPAGVLEEANSLKDAATLLEQMHVPFQRGQRRVDTATLPPEIAATMAKFAADRLFRLPMGERVVMGVMSARLPAAAPPAEQLAAARGAAAAAKQEARLRTALAALRQKADVRIITRAQQP